MRKNQHLLFPALILFIINNTTSAQSHIPIFPSLSGDDLLKELVSEYKPVTVLTYADVKDLMYSTIYNEKDSVVCVYTGHTLYLPQDTDPSMYLYMDGASDGINMEHTYPRSKGASEDNGNAFSDMHHLFPTRTAVNFSRSNFPFGEIDDIQTDTWFYLNQTQSIIPTSNIDLYSERINGRFEPRERHKGNVARAMFYFFTMYEDNALNADPVYFESQREILCAWHTQDPVDSVEWKRTYEIGQYQNNLPNPFILDSTLAYRCFCEGFTAINESNGLKTNIYPNPITDWVSISSEGKNNLQVMDLLGKVFMKKQFYHSIELDFSLMDLGIYFIVVNEEIFKVVKR